MWLFDNLSDQTLNDQLLFINLHLQILCTVPMAASANVYEEEMEEEEEEVQ